MKARTPIILASVLAVLLAFGGAVAQEESRQYYTGIYDEDFGDDWFYDEYDYGTYDFGEDDVYGYYGEEESGWFEDENTFDGFYDDEDLDNDWWFDTYDDPGDEGFWDI